MPSVSASNLNLLRTTRHATKLNLAVYQPASIWTAQVDGAQTQGDTTITVKGVSQVKAPARNFQVMFSAIGYGQNELGEARWKSYGAPTLTVGAHNTPLANNTYITVKEEIKPLAIHAVLNSSDVVFEDGVTTYTVGATGENLQYHPLARMGPPACAIIDPGTGLATINFYSSSAAIATGATLSTAAWVFPSGTPGTSATPGTEGAPVAVTWNTPGQYYVSLTVTDSNGKTHTCYRPVFIYNTITTPYTSLEISSLSGDVSSGVWRATLKVWGAASETEFPDNAMVVLFAEDWFGDTKTSIGGQYTYRENIVWVGYVRGGTIKKNAEFGYVEFDAESVSGVMTNLEGLAATLTTTAGTPTGWHQLQNMTYNRVAFHILTEHSTVSQIADCYLSLLTFTRDTLDVPEASVFDQLQTNVATPTRGRCGCSAQGMFYLEENPQLIPLADRTHPNIFANSPAPDPASTALADFRDQLDFGRDLHDKVTALIDFAAESTAAVAIYSLAPATPWASGRGERISGIRADSQGDSNIFSGLFEGYENNPFADVLLPLRGNYRIFDIFPPEQVQVTLTAAQNKRGIAWSNQRCWVKRVSYEYRPGGVLLSTVVVEKDAYGYPGITGNYPTTPPPWPPPDPPPIEPPPIVPPPPTNIPPGKGNLLYVSTHKGLAKCVGAYGTNGTDGTPVWTALNSGLSTNAKIIRWFNLDPFSRSGDHFNAGWAMTDDGLYRVTGLPDAPVWTRQLTEAQALSTAGLTIGGNCDDASLSWHFTPSVRRAGFISAYIPWLRPTSGWGFYYSWRISAIYSLDYGATWACNTALYTQLAGIFVGVGYFKRQLQVMASYHLDNVYYLCQNNFLIQSQNPTGDQTTNPYGNPQVHIARATAGNFPDFRAGMSDGDATHVPQVYLPYCNSAGTVYANDNRGYLYGWGYSGVNAVMRFDALFNPAWSSGYTPPTATAKGDASMGEIRALFSNMFNENYLVAIPSATSDIWFSSNGGTAWTQRHNVTPGAAGILIPRYQFCVPVDSNIVFFTGVGNTGYAAPCLTPDFGTTFVDISLKGQAGALDTVMGLTTTADLDESVVIVDYYKE